MRVFTTAVKALVLLGSLSSAVASPNPREGTGLNMAGAGVGSIVEKKRPVPNKRVEDAYFQKYDAMVKAKDGKDHGMKERVNYVFTDTKKITSRATRGVVVDCLAHVSGAYHTRVIVVLVKKEVKNGNEDHYGVKGWFHELLSSEYKGKDCSYYNDDAWKPESSESRNPRYHKITKKKTAQIQAIGHAKLDPRPEYRLITDNCQHFAQYLLDQL